MTRSRTNTHKSLFQVFWRRRYRTISIFNSFLSLTRELCFFSFPLFVFFCLFLSLVLRDMCVLLTMHMYTNSMSINTWFEYISKLRNPLFVFVRIYICKLKTSRKMTTKRQTMLLDPLHRVHLALVPKKKK